jgi:outer membrane protein
MRTIRSAVLLGTLLACAAPVSAQSTDREGRWLFRLRGLSMTTLHKSDEITSLGLPDNAITVSDVVFPEVDATVFLARRIALEWVLTSPQQHDVMVSGAKIGTVKQLPLTLMGQYHMVPEGTVRPYIGAGINVTFFTDVQLTIPSVGAVDLESSSMGMAGQLGADIRLMPGLFLNVDLKKALVASDITRGSSTLSAVRIHPWLASAGLGIRF